MEVRKAKGCLADLVLPLYWVALIIGLIYAGSIIGVMIGWLDAIPGWLRQMGPGGSELKLWFYAARLGMWGLIWLGSAAVYTLRRWGILPFSLGFIGFLVLDLVVRTRWIYSAALLVLPLLVILVARSYVFQHRAEALPEARKLSGWDDQDKID
jgi:hypothetical protein